jgi:hypothetical protein
MGEGEGAGEESWVGCEISPTRPGPCSSGSIQEWKSSTTVAEECLIYPEL